MTSQCNIAPGHSSSYIFYMSVADIKTALAALPLEQRGEVALWLLETLPSHDSSGDIEENLAEAERRRHELDSGQVQPVSSEEFWASLDRERSAWK